MAIISIGEKSSVIAYNVPFIAPYATITPGDVGWLHANRSTKISYTYPTNGVLAVQDPLNWHLLLTTNFFGNKYRFTSANGGYYEPSTDTYHLVDGTLSDYDTVFKYDALGGTPTTHYIVDNLTGVGYKGTRTSQKSDWQTCVLDASNASWCNLDNWFCAPSTFIDPICNRADLATESLFMRKPFQIELEQASSTPLLSLTDQFIRYSQSGGISSTFFTVPSISMDCRFHFKN